MKTQNLNILTEEERKAYFEINNKLRKPRKPKKLPEEEFNPLSLKGVVIICLCLSLLFMAIYFFMSSFHLVNNKYSHDDCSWWEYHDYEYILYLESNNYNYINLLYNICKYKTGDPVATFDNGYCYFQKEDGSNWKVNIITELK